VYRTVIISVECGTAAGYLIPFNYEFRKSEILANELHYNIAFIGLILPNLQSRVMK